MAHAKLIMNSPGRSGLEIEIGGETSIGRAPDNLVRIDDQMVSQYHAMIERRTDAFWLSDLGSRNGTAVNGDPVDCERRLYDADSISIAGVATITFCSDEDLLKPHSGYAETHAALDSTATTDEAETRQPLQPASAPRSSPLLIIAAAVIGIAVAAVAVLVITNFVGDSESAVRVLSPETGSTIRGPQTIRVDAESARDIEEITYMLDGIEFASAERPPFEVTLDPAQLEKKVRNLASGNHVLTVTVEDKEGNKKPQPDTVLLAFDTGNATADDIEEEKPREVTNKESVQPRAPQGSVDVAALSRNLAAAISGKSWFDFDSQFAGEINRQTGAYRVNVMEDASRYRRQIGNAFNSKGLPAAIGFVMAFSESKFNEPASASPGAGIDQKIGFWQVPRQIAIEQGYILPDETAAAVKDAKRSAEIAASYINDLVNAFGGMDHFMYAIACYGMPLSQAAKVRARLEEIDPNATERKDFWKMVRTGVVPREGADRVARFFAAGIVGENPQLFGLNARPLSSLY